MLDHDDFLGRLRRRLTRPLPGRTAQATMEPCAAYGRHFGPPTSDVRPAAVLLLLYLRGGAWYVALTVRHADLATHAGQVSLPGGLVESGETVRQAAERELLEEVGVAAEQLSSLGALSPLYLFSTHFFVQPWAAVATATPRFVPNPTEVAELLEVPLGDLLSVSCIGRHLHTVRGIAYQVPHYLVCGRQVWGATAMILAEFVCICRDTAAPHSLC